MKIKQYKARRKNSKCYIYGSYINMPDHTPYPIGENQEKVNIIHCITSYVPGDWGLQGKLVTNEIDIDTLEEVPELEIDIDKLLEN